MHSVDCLPGGAEEKNERAQLKKKLCIWKLSVYAARILRDVKSNTNPVTRNITKWPHFMRWIRT
jgi:hypothetical protein